MNLGHQNCFKHGKAYQFVGCEANCHLNCRICYECLRSVDNGHKKGVSNHETISMEQLAMHFEKLENYSRDSLSECDDAIDKYFKTFERLLNNQIQKQKERLHKFVRRILLTGITKDDRKLDVIMNLYNQDYSDICCSQVQAISNKLFNYVPKRNHSGFKKIIEHLSNKQAEIFSDLKDIMSCKTWDKTFLKTIQRDISFPDFEDPPPLRASRVRTEEGTPKKTLRRSIRRQQDRTDLKDVHVCLKRPLQLQGSKLVDGRQDSLFLGKLFENRNVHSSHLLYRASQHDFSVKQFHHLCDGESNTLVIVKTEFNKIIGGFTSVPWKSTANTLHSDVRRDSFLFSLTLKQKMSLIDQKSAIFNSVNFGPTFGAGADLAICHNGHFQKTSYSQFPYSYANSRYKQNNQHSTALFTGQKNGNHFLLKQWQVWKINFE